MALIFRMNNCSPSTHNKVGEMWETTEGKREMERERKRERKRERGREVKRKEKRERGKD